MARQDNWNPDYTVRASNRVAISGIQTLSTFDMRNISNQLAASVAAGTSEYIGLFAQSLKGEVYRNQRGRMTRIHREVGISAQNAALKSYMRTKTGGATGYRKEAPGPWKRYSGGAMEKALQSETVMFRAGFDGLSYVNMKAFDKRAKQWYRLNFGANGADNSKWKSKGTGGTYTMNFFGAAAGGGGSLGPFTFSNRGPSEAFEVPPGLFVGPDGQPSGLGEGRGHEFVPLKYKGINLKERPDFKNKTKSGGTLLLSHKIWGSGIAGSHFLDAGLEAITRNLPVAYTVLYQEWFEKAANGATSPISVLGVSQSDAKQFVAEINAQMDVYARSARTSRVFDALTK